MGEKEILFAFKTVLMIINDYTVRFLLATL